MIWFYADIEALYAEFVPARDTLVISRARGTTHGTVQTRVWKDAGAGSSCVVECGEVESRGSMSGYFVCRELCARGEQVGVGLGVPLQWCIGAELIDMI